MTWNYRVVVDGDGMHSLIEAYYNEQGEIFGWVEPSLDSDTPENLARSLGTMLDDALMAVRGDAPVIHVNDLPKDAVS